MSCVFSEIPCAKMQKKMRVKKTCVFPMENVRLTKTKHYKFYLMDKPDELSFGNRGRSGAGPIRRPRFVSVFSTLLNSP